MYLKILALSVFLLLPNLSFANNGTIKVLKGKVYIVSGKTKLKKPAKLGQKVYASDTVMTLKDSRLKLVMVDGNEINISPETTLEISKYQYENNGAKKNVLLNVLKGKVRSKVRQKYDDDKNKFRVKTKTAVAGVRGTDFLTSYNPQQNSSNIVTFEGRVEFGLPGANGKIMNPVAVTAGKTVSQIGRNIPSAPTAIPATQLASIDMETDADKAPDKKRLPSSEQQPKPKEKDKKQAPNKNDQAPPPKKQNRENNKDQARQPIEGQPMEGKKDEQALQPKEEPPMAAAPPMDEERAPASINPEDSMIIDTDLANTDNDNFIEEFPTNDALMPIGSLEPINEYEQMPICEFCNDVINTNDAYLRIRVQK